MFQYSLWELLSFCRCPIATVSTLSFCPIQQISVTMNEAIFPFILGRKSQNQINFPVLTKQYEKLTTISEESLTASKHRQGSHDRCLNILFLVCTSVSRVYSGRPRSQGVTKGYLILSLGCYFLIVFIFLRQDFMQPRLAGSSWSFCPPLFLSARITVLHHHFQFANYFIFYLLVYIYKIYIHTHICIYVTCHMCIHAHGMCVRRSEDKLQELFFSSHQVLPTELGFQGLAASA